MKQIDIKLLRPLFIPGAMLGVVLLVWLLAIPMVVEYHARTAGVVAQLQAELLGLRGETIAKQAEGDQLRRTTGEYEALVAEGVASPQDRLAAAAIIERQAKLHNLRDVRFAISPERQLEGPAFRNGDTSVIATEININVAGLLDTHLIDYLNAVRQQLPGRSQILVVTLEKTAAMPQGAALEAAGTGQSYAGASATLLWRTIKPPPPAVRAAAQ